MGSVDAIASSESGTLYCSGLLVSFGGLAATRALTDLQPLGKNIDRCVLLGWILILV